MRFASIAVLMTLALGLSACKAGRTTLEAEGALGPYSGAVLAGDFCFVSGKIGDRSGSFAEEAQSAIDQVATELARAGLDLSDVVASTVYLTDMGRYQEFNEVYGAAFSKPYPARVCVAVKELPAGARVEVQCTALRR